MPFHYFDEKNNCQRRSQSKQYTKRIILTHTVRGMGAILKFVFFMFSQCIYGLQIKCPYSLMIGGH